MPDHKRVLVVALIIGTLAAASFSYTVRSGDTLGRIAQRHDVTVRALAEANDISNPNVIRVGQTLTIPGSSGGSSSGSSYVVKAGDSIARIASRHGVTIAALISANRLANPNLIRPGQTLTIPGGSTSGSSGSGSSGGSSGGTSYVVKAGDSVARIASRHGVTIAALISANRLANPNLIRPGQTLTIPGGGSSSGAGATTTQPSLSDRQWVAPGAGEQAATAHTVRTGESIGRIAAHYGVSANKLIELNDISNANLIRVGQVLVIPGGSGWVCPVPGGGFGNDWGAPRSGGRLHRGNDIFAARGTQVLAPVSGVVSYQTGVLAGLQVTLVGDDGHRYFGTHLEDRGSTGRVVAGQVIGYVGNSGNAITTPPHLHFEIHVNGTEPVNPVFTLRAAC